MKIKYFAWIKDITNKDFEIIDSNYPKDINELKKYLDSNYPELQKHTSNNTIRFSLNFEYVSTNEKLVSTDEIGLFPPVSGG